MGIEVLKGKILKRIVRNTYEDEDQDKLTCDLEAKVRNLEWRKDYKFYRVFLQPNLFGKKDVVCVWGAIDSKLGNHKIIHCENDEEINIVINSIIKRRNFRGYKEVE